MCYPSRALPAGEVRKVQEWSSHPLCRWQASEGRALSRVLARAMEVKSSSVLTRDRSLVAPQALSLSVTRNECLVVAAHTAYLQWPL